MPDTSPLAAAQAGGRHALADTYDRALEKATADSLQTLIWLTARVHAGKRGSRIKQPEAIPTMAELASQAASHRPKITVADLARWHER